MGYFFRLGRKEGYVLFNDTLNTFYLRLYASGHMVKYHSDSERGRKEMFYLTTHSTHFIYGYMAFFFNIGCFDLVSNASSLTWFRSFQYIVLSCLIK